MADQGSEHVQRAIAEALENEELPRIYFNGFSTALGSADVLIVLNQQGKPVAILNASYTVAKTLAAKLGAVIATLEEISGNTIMTTDEIARFSEEQENDSA